MNNRAQHKALVVADSVHIDDSGLVRIGGAPLFRIERKAEGVLVSFLDKRDSRRVQARGGQDCVYVDADQIVRFLDDQIGLAA